MKKLPFLIAALICWILALFCILGIADAATYYYGESAAGDEGASSCANRDDIAGLNADAQSMVADDTIYLCDDEVIRTMITVPVSGSVDSPITYTSAPGDSTVISGADVITGWSSGGNGYVKENIGQAGYDNCTVVLVDGSTLLTFNADGDETDMAEGEFYHTGVDDDLYIRLSGDANPSGYTIEAQIRIASIRATGKDYIDIENLQLQGGVYGIWLFKNDDYWNITGNTVKYTGSKGIKLEGESGPVTNNTVTKNTLQYIGGAGVTDISPFAMHIDADAGFPSINNVISENLIEYPQLGFIYISNSDSNTITGNKVLGVTASNTIHLTGSDSNIVGYNIIETSGDWGIGIADGSQDNKIYNNTIDGTGTNGGCIRAYSTAGSANLIKNNIVYGALGLRVDSGGETDLESDYNCFYRSAGDIVTWAGTGYNDSEFTDYKTASEQDAESITSDPLLTDPGNDNFTLQSTSPAKNTGVDLGDTYTNGLNHNSSWPDSVSTLNQDNYGSGWEIGAFVFTGATMSGITIGKIE